MKYMINRTTNHKRKQKFIHDISILLVFLMTCAICNTGIASIVSAAETYNWSLPKKIEVTDPATGESVTKNITVNPIVTYNGNMISQEHYPMVMCDLVWMADVQSFFSDIMDFDIQYSDANDDTPVREIESFTLRNPRLDTTIVFTVGKDTATVNGIESILPYQVMWGEDAEESAAENKDKSKDTVLYIPMVWTLQQSGYTVVENAGNAIAISDSVLYYKKNYTASYDSDIYDNCIDGIYVAGNNSSSANYFHLHTVNTLSSSSVKISNQPKKNVVTITIAKTKNSLGNIKKSFSGNILKKIQMQQTSDHATQIKLWYGAKYIYTNHLDTKSLSVQLSKASFSMRVLLPDKVKTKKITTTDQYWKNKFLIVIPGNHVSYYKKNPPIKNSSKIKSIKVTKTASKNTKITVTTKKMLGYRITFTNSGYFTVKVGSPKSIYKNIVLLDPGHGGKDNGAKRAGVKEKKLNFSILYTRAKKIFEAQDSTVKAYWTRHYDTKINLYKRPKYTKKYSADLFVSLHMNSAPNKKAKGTEVYYSKQNNKARKSGLTSKIFAENMLYALTDNLDMEDRGVRSANFVVIKNNSVPAVLVELGFISSPKDRKKLKSAAFQKKAAKALYKGISETFKEYPTGR
ncbi:MAG: N-acetylmuramoyl-L-alanine amidase [Lachnospiraceae bacterium]|nr:N-acetylmuramoyl-L-alanine amidase [Lachnospiraceae bacterium]